MKKICIVTTLWSSIDNWITPFLNEYYNNKIDVTIVCNMDEAYENRLKKKFPFLHTKNISFPRGISFFSSLKSIIVLYFFLKKERFDLIQYSTPNASFYTSLVSSACKIPVRLYCQWGMVYVTRTGLKRYFLKLIEKITCKCSTIIQPDSYGNLEFCRNEGFYNENNSCVIWNGSAKGLDLKVFDLEKKQEFSLEIKKQYGISERDTIIGFVGRLGKEKGCNELFSAFRSIKCDFENVKLLFVGPIEKKDTIDPELLDYFITCEDIIKTDRVRNVEKYMSAMDIFVLPSYREGFGMSVVEASAMEIPVVVTKYPGPSSGMIDGVTGISVDVKDEKSLEDAIRFFLLNKDKAKEMGMAGRKFVANNFDYEVFKVKYMENRLALLGVKKSK